MPDKSGVLSIIGLACLFAGLIFFSSDRVSANAKFAERSDQFLYKSAVLEAPNTQFRLHNIGKIALTISNFGTFGTGSFGNVTIDGEIVPSCEYPINSNMEYLFTGALWIGAVVNGDTLVSVGYDGWVGINELFPEPGDAGAIQSRSILKFKPDYHEDAISEQDFICTYSDTFVDNAWSGEDPHDNRPHIPINVSIEQKSYAWSYDYTEDFIIFEYKITNIGELPIESMYLGIYVDAVAYHRSIEATGYTDDICGFRRSVDMPLGICFEMDSLDYAWQDTVNIAWIADNDGDPTADGRWHFASPRAATGVRVLQTPNDNLNYSFNWWISNNNSALDFGPRKTGSAEDLFRKFGSQLGTPTGDRNKYYVMSHPEFDYDQLFTAVSHADDDYLMPPNPYYAYDFADGYDTRYLLSFGPFDVEPGDTVPITIAYLAGDDFHVEPGDFEESYDPENPQEFYDRLSFYNLGVNARWAGWIYDNPGIDTDGDSDSGTFCWNYTWEDTSTFNPDSTHNPGMFVKIDSVQSYFRGDGVPDFRGASPPPPPAIKVIPEFGKIRLRWNGQDSEQFVDNFTGLPDFEGYRVYYAEDNRASDFVLLTAYDTDNYDVFIFDYEIVMFDSIVLVWKQNPVPLSLDSLRDLHGADFDPTLHDSEVNYYRDKNNDDYMFFVPHGWNQSDLTDPFLIHKVYPDASPDDPTDTTEDGFLRYYEYEYLIDNLQPSKPYYFAVTAFDFGASRLGLQAMESSPLINAVRDYPLPSSETVEEEGMGVAVYPNPYRGDGNYARVGYENRDRLQSAQRSRKIHFINLPKVCTIRIYTINGDLVKTIEHYYPGGGPESQQETWDVISRNTQEVVTGIYLWHVSSDMGEQIGKLVLIM